MKNIKIYKHASLAILSAFLIFATVGCKKLIDDTPPAELIGDDLIFDTKDSLGVNAEKFLNNIYADLPRGFNRINVSSQALFSITANVGNMLEAGSDDAVPNAITDQVQYFSTDGISASVNPDNTWNANYAGIRKVNIFLSKIDRVPLFTKGLKDRWKAEARALRAMFYFELLKRWGGIPLIGDKVFATSEQINLPRNSYAEVQAYILSELDAAMPYLLTANASSNGTFAANNYGRFGRGAAMAIKSRLLLYAASPLNNATNDLSKWSAAAVAAKAVIDSVSAGKFIYALHNTASTAHYSTTTLAGVTTTANLSAYVTSVNKFLSIFSTASNNEIILPYMSATNTSVETNNDPVGYTRAGAGKTNPTQELVDEYEMTNGKMIGETGSGYLATNPYYDRDPRFPSTIIYNGLYWLNRPVQTYDGGLDRPFGYGLRNSGETRTGYYLRKFMTSNSSATSFTATNHIFPIFRYAEILLNYAEAQNEAVGPDNTVYSAINAIRARAGMPNLPAGLSQTDMRTRIRHERRVEMAFEEQRFWDIRRWKIAENVLNGTLHGIKGTLSGSAVNYQTVDVIPVKFNAGKMYRYPIPFNELVSNPSMTQNPNW
ncbi:RagB/SusD family nutrient uptake outer membrane protein [Pedobacter chinensis]|uniref:RagB/SusD family nutrient uptake outer membrane protein n=1 Tax=Pedobacter chinensis TaxID=2282421 RepID=A0A369Q133_9SPHI|nr:RagB/SusD family nutrient uptake outer membrane protein [Pedobacter chinensis]RDC58190.1 RagB/SusD family nutrient uptake outer membrane protein [Pedobacter chinensis]